MKNFLLSIAAFSAATGYAFAQTPDSTAKQAVSAPTPAVAETAATPGKFTFSGYLDTYYFGNFNQPFDQLNTGIGGGGRAFDQRAGQFGVGLVQGKATYTSDKIDAVFDLTFGTFADLGTTVTCFRSIAGRQRQRRWPSNRRI